MADHDQESRVLLNGVKKNLDLQSHKIRVNRKIILKKLGGNMSARNLLLTKRAYRYGKEKEKTEKRSTLFDCDAADSSML